MLDLAGYDGPMTQVGSRSQLAYVRANRDEILSVVRRHRGRSVSVFGTPPSHVARSGRGATLISWLSSGRPARFSTFSI